MRPVGKKYFNVPEALNESVAALESFQEAHHAYLKKETEEARREMSRSLQTLKFLQDELSVKDELADPIRLGFLRQLTALQMGIQEVHHQGFYPDLYRDSESPLQLLKEILSNFKTALLSRGEVCPVIELSTSDNAWKDEGVLAFCREAINNLKSVKFESLWDALQCYEKSKAQLSYTFDMLSFTGNLGKH